MTRYGPAWATFAAPGDQQVDVWLLRFADPDCREALFIGPEAEQQAWAAWNRYAPSYNCFVFRLARLREPTGQAIEAGTAETVKQGSVHEHAVSNGDAPND